MSTEQLEALARQADMIDGEAEAATPAAMAQAQEQAESINLAQQNGQQVYMILEMAMPVLGALYPSLPAVYNDPAKQAVAGALGPVLAKYGISIKDIGGKYKEEIAAAFVCFPVLAATVKAIKTDITARAKNKPIEAKAEEKAPEQAQAAPAAQPAQEVRTLPTDTPSELAGA